MKDRATLAGVEPNEYTVEFIDGPLKNNTPKTIYAFYPPRMYSYWDALNLVQVVTGYGCSLSETQRYIFAEQDGNRLRYRLVRIKGN